MQKSDKEEILDKIEDLEGAKKAPSKLRVFIKRTMWIMTIVSLVICMVLAVIDDVNTKKLIKKNYEEAKANSPQIQEYQAQKAKVSRQLAQRKRLKNLGIEISNTPAEKNDLLNVKIREQYEREREEMREQEMRQEQAFDYQAELAAYNAKLAEVKAEEERLRAEAQAAAEQAGQDSVEEDGIEAQKRATKADREREVTEKILNEMEK